MNRRSTRLSAKEQALFAKRLSFLITAGVPLVSSLELLRSQAQSTKKEKIFDCIIEDVSNGQYLSTSLGRFKHIFGGDFAVNLIRIGETSGMLGQNLVYLADELKKKQILRKKILAALVYPIVITIATLGVTALVTAYIFPKILPIFRSMHIALPIYTRVLIAISSMIGAYGVWIALGIIAASTLAIFLFKKAPKFHIACDRVMLALPLFGSLAQGYTMANFCRTFGLLLKGGVPIVEALSVIGDTAGNLLYKKAFYTMAKNVAEGEKVSQQLEKFPHLFPDMLTHMVAVGEATSNLSETLLYVAEFYENEVDDLARQMSSSIEPALMVCMGVIVGFVALSVITPMYAITQNLHP